MDNASLSGKPSKVATSSMEDIPEALREAPSPLPKPRWHRVWLMGLLVGWGAFALFIGLWFASLSQSSSQTATAQKSKAASTAEPTTSTEALSSSPRGPDIVLGNSGHFAYKEAPSLELQPIGRDGRLKLRKAAARQYNAMVAAARTQGAILVPISGFRSVAEQQHLFFDVKAQRGQVAAERATVSAPPGYSEHHTGYAVDIGDGRVPATNLSPNFEKTAAFRWLQANAARYSFEMSFPKNNSQGVSYEPWHWRFVGDRDSLETFYKAKQLKIKN